MRRSALIGLLLAGAFGIPAANADILYNIDFSGSGTLPTAGSFTYDPSTSTFSGFSVTWDGINFDLTGSANSPSNGGAGFPACIGALTGGAATFAMLSGACDGAANESTGWSAGAISPSEQFQFLTSDNVLQPGGYPQLYIVQGYSIDLGSTDIFGEGDWTITAETPEPSSMPLLATAVLATLGLAVRKRVVSNR